MKKQIIAIVASVGMTLSLTPVAANAVSNGAESVNAGSACTYVTYKNPYDTTVTNIICPRGVRAWITYYVNDNTRRFGKNTGEYMSSGASIARRPYNTFAGTGGAEER